MLLPSIQGADILQDLMRGVRLVKAAKTSVPGVQTYTLLQTEVPERKLEGGGGIETVGSEFVPGGDRPINRHVESEPCEENEVDELAAKTLGTRHPPEVFPVPADGKKEGFRQKLRLAALVEGDCSGLSMCVVPWDVAWLRLLTFRDLKALRVAIRMTGKNLFVSGAGGPLLLWGCRLRRVVTACGAYLCVQHPWGAFGQPRNLRDPRDLPEGVRTLAAESRGRDRSIRLGGLCPPVAKPPAPWPPPKPHRRRVEPGGAEAEPSAPLDLALGRRGRWRRDGPACSLDGGFPDKSLLFTC
uniref:Uncharacterized protein n=1 Tax=Rangifer tarandus platyrhynchus TaxID=3082113 RepID=A0ACB0F660_RANTA|nr:unnamed protein product [Rangifer tarandus platyrhynchus]